MEIEFVEVIVPLALNATFTYRVKPDVAAGIAIGSRVVVPFGSRHFYTAIVTSLNPVPPLNTDIKYIDMVLDPEPIVIRPQLILWQWIADYYMCTIGEVFRAAVPAGLKLESETFVELSPEFSHDTIVGLSDRALTIISHLEHAEKKISLGQLTRLSGLGNLSSDISYLLSKGLIIVSERLIERYRKVRQPFVRLLGTKGKQGETSRLFAAVRGARKQETALMALIELSGFSRSDSEDTVPVSKKVLEERAQVSPAIINAMRHKGIIEIEYQETGRFIYNGPADGQLPVLSDAQSAALSEIHSSWLDNDVTLLHGVTSSGKTEIYCHLIDFTLRQGRNALLLVPEIALTSQLTTRLQRVFGNKVIIYHSKFSDNERVEIWRKVLSNPAPHIIIGARSAVFLPFSTLGLVIVDEEHESSYKQQDPAPRYNARDTATVLARTYGAKTLLASATPAIDTYYKASKGRFGLVTLSERYGGIKLPYVELVDINSERKAGNMQGLFSARLRQAVNETVSNNSQAILFLNRRGYSPVAECPHCAYVAKCGDCDVSLTYHRAVNRLVCHYCGKEYPMPVICPVCHEPGVKVIGYGTERIEEDIEKSFPDVPVLRMDLDTTRAKDSYDRIIDCFSNSEAKILVGTQMVTKGLDFERVRTVGVINADAMINAPDFRAGERAFNMIEQVAGRAGRRGERGHVIIQTRNPEHPVLLAVRNHDYHSHYIREIEERYNFNYPPFSRMINISVKHRDQEAVDRIALALSATLKQLLGNRVSGPEIPAVARVQTFHIRKLMMKFELEASMMKVRELLHDAVINLHKAGIESIRQAVIAFDVDPY